MLIKQIQLALNRVGILLSFIRLRALLNKINFVVANGQGNVGLGGQT
jgi:hypothetical protein